MATNDGDVSRRLDPPPTKDEVKFPEPDAAIPDGRVLQALSAVPEFDGAIRDQAVEWLSKGLIGDSIRNSDRAGGYLRATHFKVPNPLPNSEFRLWHVDDLLDGAAALIDRFLTTQAEWRDKLAKCFQVETEVMQHLESERIYALEIASGLYTTPYIEAFQFSESQKIGLKYSDVAITFATNLHEVIYSFASMNQQGFNSQIAGFVSSYPTYRTQQAGDLLTFTFTFPNNTSKTDTKPGWIQQTAFSQIDFQTDVGKASTGLDLARQRSTTESARIQNIGLARRTDWERDNQGYRRQRTDVARKAAEAKVAALTTPDGALNYRKQMEPLAERMRRDATDALARLDAAELGLRLLYGNSTPLPLAVRTAIDTGAVSHAVMDQASGWTRDALSWLLQFKQLDQNLVMPVSLRDLCGKPKWTEGLASGTWTVPVPASLFPDLAHVRVRGIRAHVYGCGQDAGYWTVTAKAPEQAKIRHIKANPPVLDQKALPKILLPRTGTRINAPEAEFVGMLALFNASPIGDWTVTISNSSTQRQPKSVITDVELELALAVRAVPARKKPKP